MVSCYEARHRSTALQYDSEVWKPGLEHDLEERHIPQLREQTVVWVGGL